MSSSPPPPGGGGDGRAAAAAAAGGTVRDPEPPPPSVGARALAAASSREDIEALSNALYKIPKTVEKIAERVIITNGRLAAVDFSKQLGMMAGAADILATMVQQLRKKMHLERMTDMNAKLQFIEGEADKLMLELLRDLYSGKYEPLQAIMLKDLYELIEKVIDRCRDAGNVVSHIVLKYS